MRSILSGGVIAPADLFKGGLLTLVYLAAACALFFRTYRHALRTGLIARYSAENLG